MEKWKEPTIDVIKIKSEQILTDSDQETYDKDDDKDF